MFDRGVASYAVAIGTYSGGQDVFRRQSVGDSTFFKAGNLSLSDGTTYYAAVWALDFVGHEVLRYLHVKFSCANCPFISCIADTHTCRLKRCPRG